ncbi:basic secretory protein-like protein [Mucilaginibacter sp.]|uniref:basic secretory protein-like protein n=1 Tax=Mucilaginibacter sp. TaxID=1882438 RepID=UPI003D0EB65C
MKLSIVLVFAILFISAGNHSSARIRSYKNMSNSFSETDSVARNSYTLIFIDNDAQFAKQGALVKQRMIEAFFKVYPAEAKVFNKKSIHRVTFMIDPEYQGVAATAGDTVHFNPEWMLRTPTDIDVVTHEVMHIVQEYGYSAGPVWLTEGIADYARYKFGVDNAGAKWSMPEYKTTQNYTNSYRITARFFVWMEEKVKSGVVKDLDSSLRSHTYNNDTWKELTGKTVDELWAAYASNPAIS